MKRYSLLLILLLFIFKNGYSQLSVNALSFDGINDQVTIPSVAAYQPGTGDFTIELWFRSNTVAGGAPASSILFSTRSTTVNGIEIYLSNGRPGVQFNGGGITAGVNNAPDYRDSVCHHIAVRRTAGTMNLLVDGVLKLFYSMPTSVTSAGPLCLGGRSTSANYAYLKGVMKEVRFWNRSLTTTEIIDGFNKVLPGSTANLIGYWRLNATSGQAVADLSVTANSGSLGLTSAVETSDPGFGTGCPSCAQPSVSLSPTAPSMCPGDSVLLSASTGAGYTYKWYQNAVLIPGATGSTYYAKAAAAYNVLITNSSGCAVYTNASLLQIPIDKFRVVTANVPVKNNEVCLNSGTVVLSVLNDPGATYQWYKNNVLIQFATNSSYGVTMPSPGAYSCQVNYAGCSVRSNVVNAKIFTLTAITSKTVFCQDTISLNYTANFTPLGIGTWYKNGNSVGTSTYYVTSTSGNYYYSISDTTACPSTITSNTLNIISGQPPQLTLHPTPLPEAGLSGLFTLDTCVSNGGPFFMIPVYVDGHNEDVDTAFQWYENNSWMPFTTAYYPAMHNGFLSCHLTTACGMSSVYPFIIRIIDYANPPVINVYPQTSCSADLEVYSHWDAYQWYRDGVPIPGEINNYYTATQTGSYTCSLTNRCGTIMSQSSVQSFGPSPAQISTSGAANLCSGSKLLIAYPSGYTYKWLFNNALIPGATSQNYTATVAGNYRAIVTSTCKVDTSMVLTLAPGVPVPATPGAMTGPTRVCPGSTGIVYSIPSVANATAYQWILPAGLTPLTALTGTSIMVNVSASYVSGDVQVRAGNICGYGPYRLKTVRTIVPASPGTVTGPTYGVCNSTQSYSIAAVSQATTYLWVAPPGANIVSGQGTTSVTVSFPSNYGIDTLRVSAGNTCAYGPVRKVVVRGKPQNPAAITGPSSACNGQTGVQFSITPVFGALSYTWNKPTGSTITNGQNTSTATITFGPNSGNVTVKAVNGCGISGAATKAITINCREGEMSTEPLVIYPNPSQSEFTLDGSIPALGIKMQVYDITGKLILQKEIFEHISFGSEFVPGVYIVKFVSGNSEQHIRIVKQ